MDAPNSSVIRVLLVDDHPMVREGLRSMLSGDALEVVGDAASGTEALRGVRELAPDIVLLDVELRDVDGLAVLRQIKAVAPRTAVLMVSMHDDPRLARRAVEAGAAGYVLKGVGRRELLASVQAVCDGESVLDTTLLRSLLAEATGRAGPALAASAAESLTPPEAEVLRLIADGLTNRQISERLRWSLGNVKKYVQRILEKLEVSDGTQAAVEAVRRGLLG